jgi:exo-beta-1,3-glucanase (GH17 family)
MRISLLVNILIILLMLYEISPLTFGDTSSLGTLNLANDTEKFTGICYGPFRDNEDPDFGITPTREEIEADLTLLRNLTHSIRTYTIRGTFSEIPPLCQELGIDCYPGAWISQDKTANEGELQCLITVANQNLSCIKGLIVGNEVLLRGDVSEDELIQYIKSVKENTTIPVSTAELWYTWLSHPQLAENVDFIIVHIHPYWAGSNYSDYSQHTGGIHADDAAEHVEEKWNEIKASFPNKTIMIGETGWPTQGESNANAVPSEINQSIFLSEFLELAENNSIPYFYFEAFDEKWKGKHRVSEANWGLYYSNGSLKPLLVNLIPPPARKGLSRSPRIVMSKRVTAPFEIYTDAFSSDDPCCPEIYSFFPTGYIGDWTESLTDLTDVLDYACTESPHSGETCIKIKYIPSKEGWGGAYWQYPMNNWGEYPGYNISDAAVLTFWARGMIGGEKAEFKTGGINRHAYNVYTDKNAVNNHYVPSGWYNGDSNMLFDDNWMINPHSGTSCIKVTWNGVRGNDGTKWNGIMWQNPEGNWIGDSGYGYNLTDATKLTFWARTDEPGLKVKFLIGYPDDTSGEVTIGYKELYQNWTEYEINLSSSDLSDIAGGFAFLFNDTNDPNPDGCIFYLDDIKYDKVTLDNPDKPYQDSYGPVSSGLVTLTNNWTQYTILLADDNLIQVIGGFCWVTNLSQNPTGCTIYLDDIIYEPLLIDTRSSTNPYPSISGTHNGTIRPYRDIAVSTLYTYPCAGTGGHTEYVKIWNSTTGWNVTATWNGYAGDWHNISFNNSFTLYANETYNYTIHTGSYPQIIHEHEFNATGGVITCTEFVDSNGKRHEGWIPAIRLE